MKILVLTSGSSSPKACLYEIGETLPEHPPACLWEGTAEFGKGAATIVVKNSHGSSQRQQIQASSREQVVKHLLSTLTDARVGALASVSEINAAGHRVVHGGPNFGEPVMINREVRSAIEGVSVLAPLHIAAELEGMEIVEGLLDSVPQIAVFDTGFRRQMPLEAATYPGPYEWFEKGIRRYGFHDINHQCGHTDSDVVLLQESKP
jgi:acetate kinase